MGHVVLGHGAWGGVIGHRVRVIGLGLWGRGHGIWFNMLLSFFHKKKGDKRMDGHSYKIGWVSAYHKSKYLTLLESC